MKYISILVNDDFPFKKIRKKEKFISKRNSMINTNIIVFLFFNHSNLRLDT